ncbi:MAG: hypothetical protein ACYCYR_11365 [Desulfobulbaceae bacterium]
MSKAHFFPPLKMQETLPDKGRPSGSGIEYRGLVVISKKFMYRVMSNFAASTLIFSFPVLYFVIRNRKK